MDQDNSVRHAVERWYGQRVTVTEDSVACEEPLELQVDGVSVAVLMRTPGHDEELGMGFLLTEQVIVSAKDVLRIQHCSVVPDPAAEDNVLQITLREGIKLPLERLRRNIYANSSCGVCGKATIENVMVFAPRLEEGFRMASSILFDLPERLRAVQGLFLETGGVHAAGVFDAAGRLVCAREDVGRHNAVDKVIGHAVQTGRYPLEGHILMVSGRVAFELVQKAAAARIPVIAGISAPTSLAVALAEALNMTLVGFLRGGGMNVYTHAWRLQPLPDEGRTGR